MLRADPGGQAHRRGPLRPHLAASGGGGVHDLGPPPGPGHRLHPPGAPGRGGPGERHQPLHRRGAAREPQDAARVRGGRLRRLPPVRGRRGGRGVRHRPHREVPGGHGRPRAPCRGPLRAGPAHTDHGGRDRRLRPRGARWSPRGREHPRGRVHRNPVRRGPLPVRARGAHLRPGPLGNPRPRGPGRDRRAPGRRGGGGDGLRPSRRARRRRDDGRLRRGRCEGCPGPAPARADRPRGGDARCGAGQPGAHEHRP